MTKQLDANAADSKEKSEIKLLLSKLLPSISIDHYALLFVDAGLDSMDLLQLRTEIERHSYAPIDDQQWLSFHSLNDICNGIVLHSKNALFNVEIAKPISTKNYTLEMPQMTLMGLSEMWLLKELGNLHWELICKALNCPSAELLDEKRNRLYATFARIRYQCAFDLSEFKENENLSLKSSLLRWGKNLYLSNAEGLSLPKRFTVEMMTSFSIRNQADNTNLTKSQPSADASAIPEMVNYPLFAEEFKLLKTNQLPSILLNDVSFTINSEVIYECEYQLNPYSEINGVGLLYFAAYSGISDSCEANYANTHQNLNANYELASYTLARDIFFFGNCNLKDKIVYRLHSFEIGKNGIISVQSSLYRKSDDFLMARIFALKKWQL